MENWTEIKTAFLLGKLGTVSATANSVGVHRATVMRRIEALEERLGGKLFQRHFRGYTPTELGKKLIMVAEKSDDEFRSFVVKAQSCDQGLGGEFIVSCPALLDHLAFLAVRSFRAKHPSVAVRFRSSDEVLKLEYGEANIALTLGQPPDNPDYVVRPFATLRIGLFHSAHPHPHISESQGTLRSCDPFVKCEEPVYGPAVSNWIEENIGDEQIVLSSSSVQSANDAVLSGLGAGFLPYFLGRSVDWLTEAMPSLDDWRLPVWMVTHVDLHRTAKVKAFVDELKKVPAAAQANRGDKIRADGHSCTGAPVER